MFEREAGSGLLFNTPIFYQCHTVHNHNQSCFYLCNSLSDLYCSCYFAGYFQKDPPSLLLYQVIRTVFCCFFSRKKVLEFYQRHSMSANCLAFAYRPVTEVICD